MPTDWESHWGMRIESALFVKRVHTKFDKGGDWLGFERLTCVPIQTKMVKDALLTKEERQWIKVCRACRRICCTVTDWLLFQQDHNRLCFEKLEPYLKEVDDKRAIKWLKREAERGIGMAPTGPGGFGIEWD